MRVKSILGDLMMIFYFSVSVHSWPSKTASVSSGRSVTSIEGLVKPANNCTTASLVGAWRGIQGDRNSCYMDACIYAMFSFSSVFDKILLSSVTSASSHIPNLSEIQRVLRCNIVNPLRK